MNEFLLPKEIDINFIKKYDFEIKDNYSEIEVVEIINLFTMELMVKKLCKLNNNKLSKNFIIRKFNDTLYFNTSYLKKSDINILLLIWNLEDIEYYFIENKNIFISYRFIKTFISENYTNFLNNNHKQISNNIKNQKTYLMIDKKGFIKIGKSVNPTTREKTLQSEKPDITLFAVCNSNIESILHKKYKDFRIRGEWFKLQTNDILDIINEYNFIQINKNLS